MLSTFLKSQVKSPGHFIQTCTLDNWLSGLTAKFKERQGYGTVYFLDTFSGFVGYSLHDLIKTEAKWSLQFVFLQPQVYWLGVFFLGSVSKVHYLQLLQNQFEMAKISDGIYSTINVLPYKCCYTWKGFGIFLAILLHSRVFCFYQFNRITTGIF